MLVCLVDRAWGSGPVSSVDKIGRRTLNSDLWSNL